MKQSNSEESRLEQASPKQKRQWLLLLVLSAIILRSPAFFNPIIDEDEAFYAAAGRLVNHGGKLYQDAAELKPPLLMYFYAVGFSILGVDLRLLHGATALWVLATAALIGGIVRHLSSKWEAAYLAALLYVLFTPTFVPQALSTNGEILMNLPLVISAFLFLKYERDRSGAYLFLSGFFCGLAFLFKYQSGILLAVILGYILIVKSWLAKSWPDKIAGKQSLFVIGGFASVLLSLYAIFRYHGNWEDFYFWGWKFNFIFMEDFTRQYFFQRLLAHAPRFFLIWLVLWIFTFAAIRGTIRAPRDIPPGYHLVILWLLGSALAVCVGGKFFGHYFIQLLPPLTVLAGVAIVDWWPQTVGWKRAALLAGIIIPPIIYLGVNWREEQKRMNGENRYFQTIAVEVRKLSSPDDKIFIWGRMSELYYFSQRLPASRFITSNFVVGMTTYNFADTSARYDSSRMAPMMSLLMDDLVKNRPRLIIDTAPQNFRQFGKYPISAIAPLQEFIDKNYRFAAALDRLAIYTAE
jgi:4-amino-4-deoxy-L-arabinose transferase-like glycosyltransferase